MDVIHHFGLHSDPFGSAIDPAAAFESAAFRSAREQLLDQLHQGARLVTLIGAAGTGKSLLLRAVEQIVTAEGRIVQRVDRGDLLNSTPIADSDLLLVDEADRMDDATLAALTHSASDPARPAIVLASAHRILDRLRGPLQPRQVTLGPLTPTDARAFLLDRVACAGGDPKLFSPGALGALTYAADGSPRLLRILASNALFEAALAGARTVDIGHARQAISMHQGVGALPTVDDLPAVNETPEPPIDAPSPAGQRVMDADNDAAAPASATPGPAAEDIATTDATEPPSTGDAQPPPPLEDIAARGWIRFAGLGAVVLGLASALLLMRPTTDHRSAAEKVPNVQTPPRRIAPTPPAAPLVHQPPRPTEAKPPAATSRLEAQPPPPKPQTAAPPPRIHPAVRLLYAQDQPGAAEASGRVADALRAHGYDITAIDGIPGRIRRASTHYFSTDDRAASATLNQLFVEALRAYQPEATSQIITPGRSRRANKRNTIEIWVPDSAAGASRPLRLDTPPP